MLISYKNELKINGIICDPKTKSIYIKELNGTKETKSEEIIGEYLSDQRTKEDFLILKETENNHRKRQILKNKLKSPKDEKHTIQTEKNMIEND